MALWALIRSSMVRSRAQRDAPDKAVVPTRAMIDAKYRVAMRHLGPVEWEGAALPLGRCQEGTPRLIRLQHPCSGPPPPVTAAHPAGTHVDVEWRPEDPAELADDLVIDAGLR